MGRECRTRETGGKFVIYFFFAKREGKQSFEDLGLDVGIILKCLY